MLKVAVELPGDFESAGEWLADARAMEAAGADALHVAPGGLDRQALLAALAGATSRVGITAGDASETVARLAGPRLRALDAMAWRRIEIPESRVHWRELLAAAESAGAEGVVVPLDPRLLDLLRNDDIVEDRSDLQLAQG